MIWHSSSVLVVPKGGNVAGEFVLVVAFIMGTPLSSNSIPGAMACIISDGGGPYSCTSCINPINCFIFTGSVSYVWTIFWKHSFCWRRLSQITNSTSAVWGRKSEWIRLCNSSTNKWHHFDVSLSLSITFHILSWIIWIVVVATNRGIAMPPVSLVRTWYLYTIIVPSCHLKWYRYWNRCPYESSSHHYSYF